MPDKIHYTLDSTTKELLIQYDYEFFLKQHIQQNNYTPQEIEQIYNSYNQHTRHLKQQLKKNKKQFLLYLDGMVRFAVQGGYLPAHFLIDGWTRELQIIRFEATGKDWANFDLWKKYERRKLQRKKLWDRIVKTGAILAYLLSAWKVYEIISDSAVYTSFIQSLAKVSSSFVR